MRFDDRVLAPAAKREMQATEQQRTRAQRHRLRHLELDGQERRPRFHERKQRCLVVACAGGVHMDQPVVEKRGERSGVAGDQGMGPGPLGLHDTFDAMGNRHGLTL